MAAGPGSGDHGRVSAAATRPLTVGPPKLWRRSRHRLVGGVAGGIADHLRIPPIAVRAAFAVLAFAGGFGIVAYAVFWIVVPAVPQAGDSGVTSTAEQVVAAVIGVATIVALTLTTSLGRLFVASTLALLGAALLWRQASEIDRERWLRLSRSSLSATDAGLRWVRTLLGAGLVLAGCATVLARTDLRAVGDGLVAVVVTLIGVGLITGPFWVRTMTQLGEERRERIRNQERADLTARLHDSVLQTLALVQRNATSPEEVVRLARRQERELRALLYGTEDDTGRLAEALRSVAAEIEAMYPVQVEVVVVGDEPLDDRRSALVAAVREALVNGAKHAGVPVLSLYAEVEADSVVAYVRDRGGGFDPGAVPADRQGVRGSIIGRLERHGGTATVRSAPGHGTEITMRLPR